VRSGIFFLFVNEHTPLSLNLLTKNIYALVFFASFSVVFVVVVVVVSFFFFFLFHLHEKGIF